MATLRDIIFKDHGIPEQDPRLVPPHLEQTGDPSSPVSVEGGGAVGDYLRNEGAFVGGSPTQAMRERRRARGGGVGGVAYGGGYGDAYERSFNDAMDQLRPRRGTRQKQQAFLIDEQPTVEAAQEPVETAGGRPSLPGHETYTPPADEEQIGTGEAFAVGAGRNIGSAVGGGVGAWAGAKAGALAGGAFGSFFPGAGTAIGAAIGGVIGAIGGAFGGGWLGGRLQKAVESDDFTREQERKLALARQQHPYSTLAGELTPEVASLVVGNAAGTKAILRGAAKGGRVAVDTAKAGKALRAMGKAGQDVAKATGALDDLAKAAAKTKAATKAVRAAKGAEAIKAAQLGLEEAKAAEKAARIAAKAALGEHGLLLAGEAQIGRVTVSAADLARGAKNLGYTAKAGRSVAVQGNASDWFMPEFDTPCTRLLDESEAESWADQESGTVSANPLYKAWRGVSDPWRGREKLRRIPFIHGWINGAYLKEMENRRRRYAANDYYKDGRYDAKLRKEDERKIIAGRNRDLINAAKSKSFMYSAGQLVGEQAAFWAEMGLSPTAIKLPAAAGVKGIGGVAKYFISGQLNGLIQAQGNPGGIYENYARNRENQWAITEDEFGALRLAVEREAPSDVVAAFKAWVRNNNEYMSEHAGEAFNLIGMRVIGKALPKKVATWLTRLIDDTAEPTTFIHRMFRSAGIQPVGESLEERYNDLLNAIFNSGDDEDDATFARRVHDALLPGWRQFGIELAAFAVPGAAKTTAGVLLNRRWAAKPGGKNGPQAGEDGNGGGPAAGGDDGGEAEAPPRPKVSAEEAQAWKARITALLEASGAADEARAIRDAVTPDDFMDALSEAVTGMVRRAFEGQLTEEQREVLSHEPDSRRRLVLAAQMVTSYNELERGLLAASNILDDGTLPAGMATRAVEALTGMREEWKSEIKPGMSPREQLSAVVVAATRDIQNGTVNLADARWGEAGAKALAAAVADREEDAIGELTIRALTSRFNETQRQEYDALGSADEKIAYLDSLLRGRGGQFAGVYAVASHIAGLDGKAAQRVPARVVTATLGQLRQQFPGAAAVAATDGAEMDQLRSLVAEVEKDEENKRLLEVFTEDAYRPQELQEEAEARTGEAIDEFEEEEAAGAPQESGVGSQESAGTTETAETAGMEGQTGQGDQAPAQGDQVPPQGEQAGRRAPTAREAAIAGRARRVALKDGQGNRTFNSIYDDMTKGQLAAQCKVRSDELAKLGLDVAADASEEEMRAALEAADYRRNGFVEGADLEELRGPFYKTLRTRALKALEKTGLLHEVVFREIYDLDGELTRGGYNWDGKKGTLYLTSISNETTLAHEIRHILWRAARDSTKAEMRKLYGAFRRIALNAPEEVKRYVAATYGNLVRETDSGWQVVPGREDEFLDEVFARLGEAHGGEAYFGAKEEASVAWWESCVNAGRRLLEAAMRRWLPIGKPRYYDVENGLLAIADDIMRDGTSFLDELAEAAERSGTASDEEARNISIEGDRYDKMNMEELRAEAKKRGLQPKDFPSGVWNSPKNLRRHLRLRDAVPGTRKEQAQAEQPERPWVERYFGKREKGGEARRRRVPREGHSYEEFGKEWLLEELRRRGINVPKQKKRTTARMAQRLRSHDLSIERGQARGRAQFRPSVPNVPEGHDEGEYPFYFDFVGNGGIAYPSDKLRERDKRLPKSEQRIGGEWDAITEETVQSWPPALRKFFRPVSSYEELSDIAGAADRYSEHGPMRFIADTSTNAQEPLTPDELVEKLVSDAQRLEADSASAIPPSKARKNWDAMFKEQPGTRAVRTSELQVGDRIAVALPGIDRTTELVVSARVNGMVQFEEIPPELDWSKAAPGEEQFFNFLVEADPESKQTMYVLYVAHAKEIEAAERDGVPDLAQVWQMTKEEIVGEMIREGMEDYERGSVKRTKKELIRQLVSWRNRNGVAQVTADTTGDNASTMHESNGELRERGMQTENWGGGFVQSDEGDVSFNPRGWEEDEEIPFQRASEEDEESSRARNLEGLDSLGNLGGEAGKSIRYQRADEDSRAALADIASGKEYGVLHNPKYGEIRYPLGKPGKGGLGFLHIVEHRMNGGANLDEAIDTAIRVGIAAEIGEETRSEYNTRHLEFDGTKAIIALMPDNTFIITGFEIDADETAAANRRAAELAPHPHVRSEEVIARLKGRLTLTPSEVNGENGATFRPQRAGEEGESVTRFSLRSPMERRKDLVAFHNVSAKGLAGMDSLGGLAVPSFAVTKDTIGGSEFGEISLLVHPRTIDPRNGKNKIFTNDAWTPTFPQTKLKAEPKVVGGISRRILKLLRAPENRGWDEVPQSWSADIDGGNIDDAVNRHDGDAVAAFKDSSTFKTAFVLETGRAPALERTDRQIFRNGSGLLAWADNSILPAVSERLGDRLLRDGHSLSWDDAEKLSQDQGFLKELADVIDQSEKRRALREEARKAGVEEPSLASQVEAGEFDDSAFYNIRDLADQVSAWRQRGIPRDVDRAAAMKAVNAIVDEHRDEYEEWLRKLTDGITNGKRYVRNSRELYGPDGYERPFSKLYDELTLANAVKAMLKQQDASGGGIFGRSPFGVAAREYSSLKDVIADEGRLQPKDKEKYEARRNELLDRFLDLVSKLEATYTGGEKNEFIVHGRAADALLEEWLRARGNKAAVLAGLKEWYGFKPTAEMVDELAAVMHGMSSIPEDYFEAKAYRAVGFDEIAAAIIPDNASKETRDILARRGIRTKEYKAGDNADRLRALNAAADAAGNIRFQRAEPAQKADAGQRAYYEVPFAESLREVVKPGSTVEGSVYVRDTPKVFRDIGLTPLPIMSGARHLRLNYYMDGAFRRAFGPLRNGEHAHGLGVSLEALPKLLENPVAILPNYGENAKPGSIVALTTMKRGGGRVVIPVLIEAQSRADGLPIDSHLVLTVYAKPNWVGKFVKPAIEAEKKGIGVFYVDARAASQIMPLSGLVKGGLMSGVVHTIDEAGSPVKGIFKKQIDTIQFKRWFGKSKVVDENGAPLVVYRGADFDPLEKEPGKGVVKPEAYFSADPDYARRYGPVRAYYLAIERPFDVRNPRDAARLLELRDGHDFHTGQTGALDWAEAPDAEEIETRWPGEYDGLVLDEGGDKAPDGGVAYRGLSYVPFHGGTQVKSATDNIGTFDRSNSDIRFQMAGADGESPRTIADRLDEERRTVEARGGRLLLAHHGTDRAGFTVFRDTDDQGYFFSKGRRTAGSYIRRGRPGDERRKGLPDYNELVDAFEKDGTIEHGWARVGKRFGDEWLFGRAGAELFDSKDEWQGGGKMVRAKSFRHLIYREEENIPYEDLVKEYNDYNGSSRVYDVALKMENPYVVDCHGANWDNILEWDQYDREHYARYDRVSIHANDWSGEYSLSFREYGDAKDTEEEFDSAEELVEAVRERFGEDLAARARDELREVEAGNTDGGDLLGGWGYIVPAEEPGEGFWLEPKRTRDIVGDAFMWGHDGVIFENIVDNGGGVVDVEGEPDDVYVVKEAAQVKLTDEVTYADNGRIIPADERLDWGNEDMRFQRPGKANDVPGQGLLDIGEDVLDGYAERKGIAPERRKEMKEGLRKAKRFAEKTREAWERAFSPAARAEDWKEAFATPEANRGEHPTVSRIIRELYENPDGFGADVKGLRLESSEDVAAMMMAMRSPFQEMFKVVFVDGQNRVVDARVVHVGIISATLAHPINVLGDVPKKAKGFYISHNHPSGDPSPSEDDASLTERFRECARLLGLRFHDHVVTDGERYYSFKARSADFLPEGRQSHERWEVGRPIQLRYATKVAEIAGFVRQGADTAVVFALDQKTGIRAVRLLPKGFLRSIADMSPMHVADKVRSPSIFRAIFGHALDSGSNNIILYLPEGTLEPTYASAASRNFLQALARSGAAIGINVADVLQDNSLASWKFDSAAANGLLRAAEPSAEGAFRAQKAGEEGTSGARNLEGLDNLGGEGGSAFRAQAAAWRGTGRIAGGHDTNREVVAALEATPRFDFDTPMSDGLRREVRIFDGTPSQKRRKMLAKVIAEELPKKSIRLPNGETALFDQDGIDSALWHLNVGKPAQRAAKIDFVRNVVGFAEGAIEFYSEKDEETGAQYYTLAGHGTYKKQPYYGLVTFMKESDKNVFALHAVKAIPKNVAASLLAQGTLAAEENNGNAMNFGDAAEATSAPPKRRSLGPKNIPSLLRWVLANQDKSPDDFRADFGLADGDASFRPQIADADQSPRDWSGVKVPELRRELVRRGLRPNGTPAMLRARLEEDDRQNAGGSGTSFRAQKSDDGEPFRLEGQTREEMAAEHAAAKQRQKQEAAARAKEAAARAKADAGSRALYDELYQGRLDLGIPGETGSLFAPRQNISRQDGGRNTLFQLRGEGGEGKADARGWDGARVEERTEKGRRRWVVLDKDGTVLESGLRSEAAALEVLERGRSRLDMMDGELGKLRKKDIAEIARARKALVESLANKQLTAEERVAQFKELARRVGIHESLAEKEWALAERILSQPDTQGVETAAERAARAVETWLTRASIRQLQKDILALGKKGAGKVLGSGMRSDELAEVRDAMAAIRAKSTPAEISERVNELLDRESALEELVTNGTDAHGDRISESKLEELRQELADVKLERERAQVFEGLAANHDGTKRERLLEDLARWREARETMEKLAGEERKKLLADMEEKAAKAREAREEFMQDITGGKGVPQAAVRKAMENRRTWKQRLVRFIREVMAAHMSGGKEWGEFLTQTEGGEFRETRIGKMLHNGLSKAAESEAQANEDDQNRALEILSQQFGFDPSTSFKNMTDLSEACASLFQDTVGEGEVTLRAARYEKGMKRGAVRREVSGYDESACNLKLGELMSIWLYGKQAAAIAGQDFTDTPRHDREHDVSLMESLAQHGYSAATMREIDAAMRSRGLDRLALAISADMERKSDALDGVMQKHFHSHLARIPFYAPLRRVHFGPNEKFEARAGMGGFMGLARSFLKERVRNTRDIEAANLIELWQNHNRQANHLVTHSDWTAEVGRVFRHAKMQEALDWAIGTKARGYFNSWLDLQSNGGQFRHLEGGIMDRLSRRFAAAVTINPRVALKQITSGGMALSMLPPDASTARWAADMAYIAVPTHAAEFNRFLSRKSALWRQRGSNASDAQMLVSEHVAGNKWSLVNMKINRALSVMTRLGDRMGAISGCYGIYKAWERKLAAEGMTGEALEDAALERFIDAVNAGQQSGLPEYLSYAQTTGRGFKFFYMFKTAQAAMTKNFFLHADALLKHRGPPMQHIRGMLGIYFSDVLFKLMGMAMMPLFAVALGAGGDDPEKDAEARKKGGWKIGKTMIQSLVDAPFSGLFVAGDVVSAVTDHVLSKAGSKARLEQSPRMLEIAPKLLPSFDVWNEAVMGFDKLTAGDIAKAADYAVRTVTEYFGAPYVTVAEDFAKGAWDAIHGEELTGPQRIARALTFSRSAVGAPKPKAPAKEKAAPAAKTPATPPPKPQPQTRAPQPYQPTGWPYAPANSRRSSFYESAGYRPAAGW